jgi:phosphopantetheinyl transferase
VVGNDIVDLDLADKGAYKRERFLNKVLLPSEQKLVRDSEDPGTLFWVLWSMKESAYKLHFRKHLTRALNPIRFRCFFDGDYDLGPEVRFSGRVEVGDEVYQTNTILCKDFVHTTAIDGSEDIRIQSEEVSAGSPIKIREKTIDALVGSIGATSDLRSDKIEFTKDTNGLPFLTDTCKGIFKPCSISHHGRFGAYAVAI